LGRIPLASEPQTILRGVFCVIRYISRCYPPSGAWSFSYGILRFSRHGVAIVYSVSCSRRLHFPQLLSNSVLYGALVYFLNSFLIIYCKKQKQISWIASPYWD
jgi:hypothetical protein